MASHVKPYQTLDSLGLFCPEPVFRTRRVLDEMTVGQVLEVIADDPASEEDIPRLVKNIGQKLLKTFDQNGEYHFLIKKIK